MNSCCTMPVEIIAEDKHKMGDECCLVVEKTPAPEKAECPIAQTSSNKVQRRTLEHLLKPEQVDKIKDVQYYYCDDPNCEIVYFSNEDVPYFTKSDISVKIFSKDKGDDVNVCYCFDWTRAKIKEHINSGGMSPSIEIAKSVKEGLCHCDIKNPKGQCCLGDVNAVVKKSQSFIF